MGVKDGCKAFICMLLYCMPFICFVIAIYSILSHKDMQYVLQCFLVGVSIYNLWQPIDELDISKVKFFIFKLTQGVNIIVAILIFRKLSITSCITYFVISSCVGYFVSFNYNIALWFGFIKEMLKE